MVLWPRGMVLWPRGMVLWPRGMVLWPRGMVRWDLPQYPFPSWLSTSLNYYGCQAEPWFDSWVPLLLSLSVVAPRSLALGRLLYVLIIPVHGNHLPLSIQGRVPSVLRGSESRRHSPGPFTLATSCEALFVSTHEVPSVHGENARAPPFSSRRPREANSYFLYTSFNSPLAAPFAASFAAAVITPPSPSSRLSSTSLAPLLSCFTAATGSLVIFVVLLPSG
jgi:hypothetical protein